MKTLARQLDQFYTQPELATVLVAHVRAYLGRGRKTARWLEPSAGGGAFLDALPAGTLALDIAPADPRVTTADFLAFDPPFDPHWIVVGNPPFGKNSTLAIQFFNRAARFAQVIAFIVPRTFEKQSVQRRLSLDFHLVRELPVPEDSFTFEGRTVHVPCVFQIWERRAEPRVIPKLPTTHPDFTWGDRQEADFAFQRVGAQAGAIKDVGPDRRGLASPSHHFIHVLDRHRVREVRACFEAMDWTDIKHRTAGNPSIAKTEIVAHYTAAQRAD